MASKIDRALSTGTIVKGKFRKPQLAEPGYIHPVTGFDLEADVSTAQPFLLSVDDGSGAIYRIDDWPDVLRALTRDGYRESVNFWYNLQYDFEGLVRFLPQEVGVRLYGGLVCRLDDKGRLRENGAWSLGYVPKKAFTLKRGKHVWRWFDAWQYYQCGLAKAVEDNLPGEAKGGFEREYTNRDRYLEDEDYRRDMNEYALDDARLCRLLGEIIVRGVNQFVNTKAFYSSARVAEDYFTSKGFKPPRTGAGVWKWFMKSYHGGRSEMVKKGFFEECTVIDIKSAYPFAMRDMPILTDGMQTRRVTNEVDDCAEYGAYVVDCTVPKDWYLGPLPVNEGLVTFPVGGFEDTVVDKITLGLLDFLGIDYSVKSGIEIHDPNATYMLGPLIEELYELKETAKEPAVKYAAKIAMNGLYGKMIQLIDDTTVEEILSLRELDESDYSDLIFVLDKVYKRKHTGQFRTGGLFAPMYASYITSTTRAQMLKKALEVGPEDTIAMHTDSLLLRGRYRGETGQKLGDWEIESLKLKSTGKKHKLESRETCIVKCGFYAVSVHGEKKIRARGIGRLQTVTDESYPVKRRYGLAQAVKRNYEKLNLIEHKDIRSSLMADKKRIWERPITKKAIEEREWVDSRPLVVA